MKTHKPLMKACVIAPMGGLAQISALLIPCSNVLASPTLSLFFFSFIFFIFISASGCETLQKADRREKPPDVEERRRA